MNPMSSQNHPQLFTYLKASAFDLQSYEGYFFHKLLLDLKANADVESGKIRFVTGAGMGGDPSSAMCDDIIVYLSSDETDYLFAPIGFIVVPHPRTLKPSILVPPWVRRKMNMDDEDYQECLKLNPMRFRLINNDQRLKTIKQHLFDKTLVSNKKQQGFPVLPNIFL